MIAFLESHLPRLRPQSYDRPRGLVPDRVDLRPKHESLVVGFEQHHVAVAETGAGDADEEIVGFWRGDGDSVEVQFVVVIVVSMKG